MDGPAVMRCPFAPVAAAAAALAAVTAWRRRRGALRGRCVLITGAGSGIGRAVALRLARLAKSGRTGMSLALVDIDAESAKQVAKEALEIAPAEPGGPLPLQVFCYHGDVGDEEQVAALCKRIEVDVAPQTPSIAILSAGVVGGRPFLPQCLHDTSDQPDPLTCADIRRTVETNLLGCFWFAHRLMPRMVAEQSGAVLFMSSVMGFLGSARLPDYCSSKWALLGLTESLRLELRARGLKGVGVSAVCPYLVDTGLFHGAFVAADRKTTFRRLLAYLRSLVFPVLHADDVAQALTDALDAGRWHELPPQIVLPSYAAWLTPVLRSLPHSLQYLILDWGGGCFGMDSFHGAKGLTT